MKEALKIFGIALAAALFVDWLAAMGWTPGELMARNATPNAETPDA